ncbi:7357_t:CDS:2, partial [Gigaspora margarita]
VEMDIDTKTEQFEVRDYEEVDQALEVQNKKKLNPLVERKKEVFQEQNKEVLRRKEKEKENQHTYLEREKTEGGHRSALIAPKGALVVLKDNSALDK